MTTGSESYVVRIYRRDPRNPTHVTGLVECADPELNRMFHSVSELLELLALDRRRRRAPPALDRRRSDR